MFRNVSTAREGQRKARQAVVAQLIMLAGLALCAVADIPEPIFWAFVLGVTGNLGAFTWGNVKVHQLGGTNGTTKQENT